ncbi:MAG: ATP synthase F0 subunit B [Gemmataceae bacterium]
MRAGLSTRIVAVTVALALLLGGPAWAAKAAPADPHAANAQKADPAHATGDSHAKGGNIDVFDGWLDLTIWTIVVFLVLFGILSKFAWPQIRDGLDRRERAIARDKQEAERAKHEASALREQLAQEMAKANDQIRQMIDKARQDAQKTAADELSRGKQELQAERERLQRELKLSTDNALREIWSQGAQLATMISSRAVRKQMNVDDHRALLDEALKDFRAAADLRRQNLESSRA